jgi:hypothetical protein
MRVIQTSKNQISCELLLSGDAIMLRCKNGSLSQDVVTMDTGFNIIFALSLLHDHL